jgi:hypothetical protein
MSKSIKILGYLLIFFLIAVLTECASSRKNPWLEKRQKASRINTTQLGRNRYYFSTGYQKKLIKSYKSKRPKF